MIQLIIGANLALFLALAARITKFDRDKSFYPTVLIVIATYYVLFAFIAQEAILEEVIAALIFILVAIVGGLAYPALVGIGIICHGIFDYLHSNFIDNSGVPVWWPAFCAGVDVILGIWVLWLTRQNQESK